mgnify:CR=1 FL=1
MFHLSMSISLVQIRHSYLIKREREKGREEEGEEERKREGERKSYPQFGSKEYPK